MKKFFKNTTHNYIRKAFYSKEPFYLIGSKIILQDQLLAFEEEHNKVVIYSEGIDQEVLQMLIDSGYIRIENIPTFMFLNEDEVNSETSKELDMGGWEEIHHLK